MDRETVAERGSVILNIISTVNDAPNLSTKSTQPMKDASIGIFACDHFAGGSANPYIPYGNGMNNIRASLSTDKTTSERSWKFRLSTVDNDYPSLILTSKKDEMENKVLADVFAYLPYNDTIASPERIPFKVGLGDYSSTTTIPNYFQDVMYAEENASAVTNKSIDPEAVDEHGVKLDYVDVTFTFKHALALINISMRINNDKYNHPDADGNTSYCLNEVIIRKQTGGHLYKGGNMNAITGGLSDLVPADSLVVAKETSSTSRKSFSMPYSTIVPTQPGEDYNDDEYAFSFVIDGVEISSKFYLKKEQLRHYDADGNPTEIFGFQPGYKYSFSFVYDNFVRLEGITISEWEVQSEPLYEIEI